MILLNRLTPLINGLKHDLIEKCQNISTNAQSSIFWWWSGVGGGRGGEGKYKARGGGRERFWGDPLGVEKQRFRAKCS